MLLEDDQFPVALAIVWATAFSTVVVDPEMVAKFVVEFTATVRREYPEPVASVPIELMLGVTVKRAR
jgi:hypothetical protein